MTTNPNDPAFSAVDSSLKGDNGAAFVQEGLTKREYFAAAALQGLCANPNFDRFSDDDYAKAARHSADSLIRELNEASTPNLNRRSLYQKVAIGTPVFTGTLDDIRDQADGDGFESRLQTMQFQKGR